MAVAMFDWIKSTNWLLWILNSRYSWHKDKPSAGWKVAQDENSKTMRGCWEEASGGWVALNSGAVVWWNTTVIHQSNVPGAENCITCKTARFFKAMLSAAIVVSCLLALTSMVTMTSFGFLNIDFLQSLPHNRFQPTVHAIVLGCPFFFIVMPFPIRISFSSGPL